jgi:hypothetical protein
MAGKGAVLCRIFHPAFSCRHRSAVAELSDVLAWIAANAIGQALLIVCFMPIVGVVVGIAMGRRWLP